MKRTAKWHKKVTLKELQHIADCSSSGTPTLGSLRNENIKGKYEEVGG